MRFSRADIERGAGRGISSQAFDRADDIIEVDVIAPGRVVLDHDGAGGRIDRLLDDVRDQEI